MAAGVERLLHLMNPRVHGRVFTDDEITGCVVKLVAIPMMDLGAIRDATAEHLLNDENVL